MNWLYRFMYGRYGADQLTFALIILYLILSLTLTLIPVPLIWLLAYIPMVFCFLSDAVPKYREAPGGKLGVFESVEPGEKLVQIRKSKF